MTRHIRLVSLPAILVLFGAIACEKGPDEASSVSPTEDAMTPVATANRFCPIQAENKVPDLPPTVEWEGQTIGFCCEDCLPAWNEADAAERERMLVAVQPHEHGG